MGLDGMRKSHHLQSKMVSLLLLHDLVERVYICFFVLGLRSLIRYTQSSSPLRQIVT